MHEILGGRTTDRLAVYLPSLRGGGAERVMVTLANAIAAQGISVDLVLANAEGPYRKGVAEHVHIMDLRSRRVIFSLVPLMRYLRNRRPAAMISAMRHANVVAVAAKNLAGVSTRMVISEHNIISTARKSLKFFRERFLPLCMRVTYPCADRIIAVSDGVASDLSSTVGIERGRIQVVYNPIVADKLLELSQQAVEHKWFLSINVPVVMAVGRLTRQKDFQTLIRAFFLLRKHMAARLIILGEGELRGELETLVAKLGLTEEVDMPGFVDNPFAWMRNASLIVVSSRWEGFGNVLVEAMACGTPVVSTACPSGPGEILEGGRWGRLVPVGDAEALADAMQASLTESNRIDVKSRAAVFSVERAVKGYLSAMKGSDTGDRSPAGSIVNAS